MLTATADPWHLIVARLLEKSVVQLSDNCSGFVVNEAEDYVLTAKHCGAEDPSKPVVVDKIPGKVVATDVQKDLLIVHVPGIDKPALKFAGSATVYGQVVASFGYGGGYERPMLRITNVSQGRLHRWSVRRSNRERIGRSRGDCPDVHANDGHWPLSGRDSETGRQVLAEVPAMTGYWFVFGVFIAIVAAMFYGTKDERE
jgi:hypothetical protein